MFFNVPKRLMRRAAHAEQVGKGHVGRHGLQLAERAHRAGEADAPRGWRVLAGDQFQKRRLAGAVATDPRGAFLIETETQV
jgi:hypothetical protein